MATTVTSKGQVTIPKRVRDRLAIGPGSRVEFELTPAGQVVILKVGDDQPAGRHGSLRGRAAAGRPPTRSWRSRAATLERHLIDTNVLLDVVTSDPVWADWSLAALEVASAAGPAWINDVIYAELSVRFASIESLDGVLADARLDLAPDAVRHSVPGRHAAAIAPTFPP